jgi:hypothetical protein
VGIAAVGTFEFVIDENTPFSAGDNPLRAPTELSDARELLGTGIAQY